MTDRELLEKTLEAMEHLHRTGDTQVFDLCYAPELIPALKERLAQPEPAQVSPLEFNHMTLDKEHMVGKPIFWAEWPNKEKPND